MQIRPDMDGSSCLDTHKMMIATFVVKRRSVLSDLQYSVFEACNAPVSLKQNSAFKEYALSKASVTQKPAISECLAQ